MKNIVVVDTKLMAYDTFHRHESIFSLFSTIENACRGMVNPKVVFAFDPAGGSRKRKELYPGYKAHRKVVRAKQSLSEQERHANFIKHYYKLENLMKFFGSVISLEGYEADDIANLVCERLGGDNDYHITLLSSDKDWASNFTFGDNITQVSFKRGVVYPHTCEQVFELPADIILPYQALVGVDKENIKGVFRFGKVTFKKLMKTRTFEETIDALEDMVARGVNGMKLPEGYSTVRELYNFNWEVLKPITISELSEEEVTSFKKKFNSKEIGNKSDLDDVLLDSFNTFHAFPTPVINFFRLPR